jgi:hypothetical protein
MELEQVEQCRDKRDLRLEQRVLPVPHGSPSRIRRPGEAKTREGAGRTRHNLDFKERQMYRVRLCSFFCGEVHRV